MSAEVVTQKPWEYTLYRCADRWILSVVCGGAAMYELNIALDSAQQAQVLGDSAKLDALAAAIRSDPQSWAARSVDLPV